MIQRVFFNEPEHRYFRNEAMTEEVPGVSSILKHFGYVNFEGVPQWQLDRAAAYGDRVHDTLRLHDLGRLASYDTIIAGEIMSWKKFLADVKPEFLIIEEPLYSKVWNFAGTLDRYWLGNLADIKTGQWSYAHELQTALYRILIEENFPKLKVKERMTIEVKPDGYKIIPHRNKNDDTIAKCLLSIYNDKMKKGLTLCKQ